MTVTPRLPVEAPPDGLCPYSAVCAWKWISTIDKPQPVEDADTRDDRPFTDTDRAYWRRRVEQAEARAELAESLNRELRAKLERKSA